MLHVPFRGGVRGGKDQFTWDSVKTDKDRECYLGHSIKAPVGRWQKGKDIHWYANENSLQTKNSKNEEFQKAKDMEEKALMAALGYKVVDKPKEIEIKKERSESESDLEEEEEIKRDSRNKKHKKNKSKVSGPSTLSSSDKKNLDTMLKKLVIKNGLDAVLKALIVESSDDDDNDEQGSSKKTSKKEEKNNKSKKSKKKESSTDDDSSQDERFRRKKNSKYSSDDDESSDDTRKKHNDSKRKRSRERERDYNSKRYNR